MTQRTDYFFIHIKSIYPNFQRPSELDEEIWDEILTPYNADEIKTAIKSYRKNEDGAFAPIPSKFTPYLHKIKKQNKPEALPFSPEHYLMQEDIKNHRCKYLYPVYVEAVKYTTTDLLKKYISNKKLKEMPHEERYKLAVEYGLFEHFQHTLNLVANKRGENNAQNQSITIR